MAERSIVPIPKTFAELVTAVRGALIMGQARADRAYLESYRNTGLFIDAHMLYHQERADYGAKVIPQLAGALGCGAMLLYRCLKFVREYPILSRGIELSWTHYRVLLEVSDKSQRKALESAARKNHWPAPELERRVRAFNAIDLAPAAAGEGTVPAGKPPPLLKPNQGTPGIAQIISVDDALTVDLGFASYFDPPADSGPAPKAGALVTVDGNGRIAPAEGATKADLFNYRVKILRVVDGDTLWVKIYLRPRQWVKQKLRLRSLDCPELSTPEGKAAKRFVEALVARAKSVVINTTKPDKFDRYLADVFLTMSDGEEIYLNNALLAHGHAVRKEKWQFGDWEKDLL